MEEKLMAAKNKYQCDACEHYWEPNYMTRPPINARSAGALKFISQQDTNGLQKNPDRKYGEYY